MRTLHLRWKFWLAIMAWLLLSQLTPVFAFKLVPISMNFEPSGRGANRNFRLENPSDAAVAVQISIVKREMDIDGKETYLPADSDFTVFPPQTVLQPNQNQTLRVMWLGKTKSAKELNYRILAEQLPIGLDKEKQSESKIKIVIRYLGSIYVIPKGAKPRVVVDSVGQEKKGDKTNLVITLNNLGNAHALLRDLKLRLSIDNKVVELTGPQLKGMDAENVLSQQKRRFVIPCPKGFENNTVQVELEFNGAR